MTGGPFGAFCFFLIVQEISTESDQSIGDTSSLFFHLWKQSGMSHKWFLSGGAIQIFLKPWLSDLSVVRTPEKGLMIKTGAVVVTTVH